MTVDVTKRTIGIIASSQHNPTILPPLKEWLESKGFNVVVSAPGAERSGNADIWLWAMKDDELAGFNPEAKDIALAATAVGGFSIIHPAVSISNKNKSVASNEFNNCFWMVDSHDTKRTALEIGIPDEKIVILDSLEKRVAYHLALCLVVPEVFTLFEAAKDILAASGIKNETWEIVKKTAHRTASQYVDGHYHGPASRGDRQTLKQHFLLLREKTPWLVPLYSELIQYRIARRTIDAQKFDDLGIGKTIWDTTSTSLDTQDDRSTSFISEDAARAILVEVQSQLPCAPLLISITFFQLQASTGAEPLKANLSGQGFALHWNNNVYTAFEKQVSYFLNDPGHDGISKRISSADVSNVRPYIVVAENKNGMFRNESNDFFDVITSNISATEEKITRTADGTFQTIIFGGKKEDGGDRHINGCSCDGWFPIQYLDVAELVIPLFRFKTSDGKPLLEGLVTVVSTISGLARLTPTRISEIQSLALKRYLATGYLERRIIELGRTETKAELYKKIEESLEKIRDLREPFKKLGVELDTMETVVNPHRLMRGAVPLEAIVDELKIHFNGDKHNVDAWDQSDGDNLLEAWKACSALPGLKQGLGEDYAGYFPTENGDWKCMAYIMKALKDKKCPSIWVLPETDMSKAIALENDVSPLAWALALNEMNPTVHWDNSTPTFIVTVIDDGRDLSTLLSMAKDKFNAPINDLSSEHSSGILGLLARASSDTDALDKASIQLGVLECRFHYPLRPIE